MAKRIVILGAASQNSVNLNVNCVFWFPITSGPLAQSSGSAWAGASGPENAAVQSGAVLEEQNSFQFPMGTPPANIEAYLLQYWTNRNTQIGGKGPAQFAGVFNDSATGWSA